MDIFKNVAVIKEVKSKDNIEVLVLGESKNRILRASSFYAAGLKEQLESGEMIFVNFDETTNCIIEDN